MVAGSYEKKNERVTSTCAERCECCTKMHFMGGSVCILNLRPFQYASEHNSESECDLSDSVEGVGAAGSGYRMDEESRRQVRNVDRME